VFAIGLGVTLFNFLWVIPHFSPTGANPFAGRYAAVGGTPEGIAHKLFTEPAAFIHVVATGHNVVYFLLLFAPFLGLCFFEPLLLAGAIPELAITLLSSRGTSISSHWAEGAVPFVVSAAVFGAARFRGQGGRLAGRVLVATACVAVLSPVTLAIRDVPMLESPATSAKEHAVSLVPEGAPVSATNQLGSHLSDRRDIFVFPTVSRAQWIVADTNDRMYHRPAVMRGDVRKYESDRTWQVVFHSHGVVVLHKRPTS